ncbi:hypothetical protein ONZ45_g18910 [Pleurotus djamor]|nr:hypothetical protein ONZ45_g18910 [Pleurotus djamor]
MIVSLQATQCDSAVEDEQSDGVIYDSKFFRSHFGNLTVYAYATRLPFAWVAAFRFYPYTGSELYEKRLHDSFLHTAIMSTSRQPQYESLSFTGIKVKQDGVVLEEQYTAVMSNEIAQVLALANDDDRIRAVILTADHNAPAYCSGADMSSSWASLPSVDELGEHSISSYLLPRLLGQAAAFALLLSGKLFSPTHPPLEPALEFAKELGVTTSAVSIASTKALLNRPTATPEEGHPAESYLLKKTTRGEGTDSIEGAKAFKEGRAPEFKDTVGVMKHWAPWWKNLDVSVGTPKL